MFGDCAIIITNSEIVGIGAARDWLLDTFKGFAEESEGRMNVELCEFGSGIQISVYLGRWTWTRWIQERKVLIY